jgi:pyruvate kinase
VFTSNKRITQLSLLWGVKSYYYDKIVSTDDTVTDNEIAREKGYVSKGDFLINLAAILKKRNGQYHEFQK